MTTEQEAEAESLAENLEIEPGDREANQAGATIAALLEERRALKEALTRLSNFIAESLERRSMDSVALETEWHKAGAALAIAARPVGE